MRLDFFAGTFPAYCGPTDFVTGFRQLPEARELEDFKGYVHWALGLEHQSCKRSSLSADDWWQPTQAWVSLMSGPETRNALRRPVCQDKGRRLLPGSLPRISPTRYRSPRPTSVMMMAMLETVGIVGAGLITAALFFATTLLIDRRRAVWPVLGAASGLTGLTAGLVLWGVLPWWVYIVSLAVLVVGYRGAYSAQLGKRRRGAESADQAAKIDKQRSQRRPFWRVALSVGISVFLVLLLSMTAMSVIEAMAGRSPWALITGHGQLGPTTTVGGVVGTTPSP
jgi:hypothetical protein